MLTFAAFPDRNRVQEDKGREADGLLLEQVFERFTHVGSLGRAGRSLAFDRHPRCIECAIVARLLLGYSLLDRLCTLKAAGGIEISALPAAVQLETTPGAPAPGIEDNGKN